MTDIEDEQIRSQLVQNLLVLIGIATASQMSDHGRMVMMDGLRQQMAYLLAQNPKEIEVAPIYQ